MSEQGSGRKPNQRMKHYLVLQYLMHNTDENTVATSKEIVDCLVNDYGISAERRSIYKDIEEINIVMYMLENEIGFDEAREELLDDEEGELKSIVYDKNRKGFYLKRKYQFDDIRLLVECINSSRFLAENQTSLLRDIVYELVSDNQKEQLEHDVLLTDRIRTSNKSVLDNISTINEAMCKEKQGKKHIPEKISFQYLKYDIDNLEKQTTRRKGELYVVSPYRLIINDGYYYLLAFDDKSKEPRTFRVDRMKNVVSTGEVREGADEVEKVDPKTLFGMFSGNIRQITLRCINKLLDTMVDRFGTKDAVYKKYDDNHFTVSAQMAVSKQFYGWLCGFGKEVKIVSPVDIEEEYAKHLLKTQEMYKDVLR